MSELKVMGENFVLVGEAIIKPENFVKIDALGKNGWMKKTINLGVKISDTNRIYVGAEAGFWSDEIIEKTKNETGNDERGKSKRKQNWIYNGEMVNGKWVADNIPFDKRFDKDAINKIPYYNKIRVALEPQSDLDANGDIECVEKEFVFMGDAIDEIKKYLKHGDRIYVYGKTEINRYFSDKTNKVEVRFNRVISQIRLARHDEENQAVGTTNFYFTKDSFDKSEFKKDKKYYIFGHRTVKDNEKRIVPVPVTYVLDFSNPNIDWEDEEIKERVEYLKEVFESVKKNKVYSTTWRYMIFEGNEEVELTEKDLSPSLKKRIKLGFITLEQAIKQMRGNAIGDKIKELKLVMPLGENDKELCEDLEESDLVPPTIENKTSEVKEKIEEEKKKQEEEIKKDITSSFDAMFK